MHFINLRCFLILIFPLLVLTFVCTAQTDNSGTAPFSIIKINFEKHRIEPVYVPFDVPFVIAAPAADSLGIDTITVICYTRNKKGIDSRIFSLLLTKDMFFRDTIYANQQKELLRPGLAYQFYFIVHRGITTKEDSELLARLRPKISAQLETLYNDSHGTGGNITLINNLNNSNKLESLKNAMQLETDTYFHKKHLDLKNQIKSAINETNVKAFVTAHFYPAMTLKRNMLSTIEDKMISISKDYHNDTTNANNNFFNWRIFQLLDANPADFKLDSGMRIFIHNVILNPDTLQFGIHALSSSVDQEIFEWLDIPTISINEYITRSNSFKINCIRIANLFKQIRSDPSILNKVLKRISGNPVNQKKLEDITNAEMNNYLSHYITRIEYLSKYISDYGAAAKALDSIYQNASFHVKAEFDLFFTDNTVGLTSADFVTRGSFYIIPDIGFTYINAYPGQIRPYIGVEFNFYPMNREAEYSLLKPSPQHYTFFGNVWRNMSFTIGATVFNGFSSKDKYNDLFGTTGSLLTGLSLRINSGIRIGGGACFVYKKSLNPLADQKYLGELGYFSLSVDLNLKKWLGTFGTVFWK